MTDEQPTAPIAATPAVAGWGSLPTAPAEPGVAAPSSEGGFGSRLKQALGMRSPDQKAAVELYRELALASAEPGADIDSLAARIAEAAEAGDVKPKEREEVALMAFRAAVETVTADDLVTEDEEATINGVADALGFDNAFLNAKATPELYRLTIARANAGRLNPMDEHQLFTQGDEPVYHECVATLLKEVVIKEYQGGYGGVSFKVAKGVRINTGKTRGRMVPVGTQIQAADAGVFSITDRRAVYAGQRKTLEFKFDKLVGVQLYDDAITLQVSNRQAPATFSFDDTELTAAILNAAASRQG